MVFPPFLLLCQCLRHFPGNRSLPRLHSPMVSRTLYIRSPQMRHPRSSPLHRTCLMNVGRTWPRSSKQYAITRASLNIRQRVSLLWRPSSSACIWKVLWESVRTITWPTSSNILSPCTAEIKRRLHRGQARMAHRLMGKDRLTLMAILKRSSEFGFFLLTPLFIGLATSLVPSQWLCSVFICTGLALVMR